VLRGSGTTAADEAQALARTVLPSSTATIGGRRLSGGGEERSEERSELPLPIPTAATASLRNRPPGPKTGDRRASERR